MQTAVVSDIHGNLSALEAVIADIERRAPDVVFHGGDLALMGARPAEVVDRIRELGWPGVVGNADEVLWRPEGKGEQLERAPKLRPLIDLLYDEHAPATAALLGEERIAWLRELPEERRAGDLLVLHASPGDLWRAPRPDAAEAELLEVYGECKARVVSHGHIHRAYVRPVGDFLVANNGAVGMPWDHDPRASYLLVDDGHAEIVRVDYDAEREAALLLESGYPDADRIARMLRSGRYVSPRAGAR